MSNKKPTILITGAAGFLGGAIIRELQRPDAVLQAGEIRAVDVRPVEHDGVVAAKADVRNPDDLRAVCEGVDLVFHCAAIIDWGQHPESLLEAVNSAGTDNVINACRAAGVRALVATSSEDVVYTGEPIRDGDESLPYPSRYVNAYCRTKTEAERAVIAANGDLRTAAIRPCGMWGEGDPYHIGSLVEMARRGMLFRVGDGSAHFQHVYVGNVAHGHLLAGRALLDDQDPAAAGQVYFITDFPAQNFFDYLQPVIEGTGLQMRSTRLPKALMYSVGVAMELSAWLLRPIYRFNPVVSRFAVDFVTQDFTFVSDKAARDLGYAPIYSEEEAFARTIEYFRHRERQHV